MASQSDQHKELFQRLLAGELSPEDTRKLLTWLGNNELDEEAEALVSAQLGSTSGAAEISAETRAALQTRLAAILNEPPQSKRAALPSIPSWWRYAAAVALLLIGGVTYFLLNRTTVPEPELTVVNEPVKDIPAGKDGAVLTLADGSVVVLDSLGNGLVATQNGSKLVLQDGQLKYAAAANASTVVYNTISTPKGRQFKLQLADGTQVWLNAASSLRYPASFNGATREVEVTGEVYFEVAKKELPSGKRSPFIVKINQQTRVEVLGTHFNVNCYANEESINTTLLEGAVRVISGPFKTLIKPGEQARIARLKPGDPGDVTGKIAVASSVSIDKVMAWKNGVFDFQDASLEEVMRQLERWYAIEVVYQKGIPKIEFIGKMGRDLSLANVLRGLEMSNVHFRIESENRLLVFP